VRLLKAVTISLLCWPVVFGQGAGSTATDWLPEFADVPPQLYGLLGSLHGLADCLSKGPDHSPQQNQILVELEDLSRGLLHGWDQANRNSWVKVPPPAAYQDSLNEDLQACQAAIESTNARARENFWQGLAEDLRIKAEDCHKGGMGRTIELAVTTWDGDKTSSGWQVFYKRQFQGLASREFQMPNLSSPTTKHQLPPGNYLVRAEKSLGGEARQIPPSPIQIFGQNRISADIKTR